MAEAEFADLLDSRVYSRERLFPHSACISALLDLLPIIRRLKRLTDARGETAIFVATGANVVAFYVNRASFEISEKPPRNTLGGELAGAAEQTDVRPGHCGAHHLIETRAL